jgi:hypothetical protein
VTSLPPFRIAAVLLLVFALAVPPLRTFAGTTGSLSIVVRDATSGAPVAGAKVTLASPSQIANGTTNGSGSVAFLTLAPDTYTLSIEKQGYDPISATGLTISADQAQTLSYTFDKSLKTVARTRSRSTADLVRPGTTVDAYSVDAATQGRVTGLGGGGSLDQAYSALATVPGVFVPSGSNGWSQAAGVTVRGGTHIQVGYEFDGVPINVGYNFFPGSQLSTLGQQELQVYTGSAPANANSQGLSGFINQVIKTGTYPGTLSFDAATGTPFYHKIAIEASGATPDRNFSYYLGTLAANQSYRLVDNFNGASYTYPYGTVFNTAPCPGGAAAKNFAACYPESTLAGLGVGPGGFQYVPPNYGNPAYQQDRETVVNLHVGLPHGKDGLKDDVQLLYNVGFLQTDFYTAYNDLPANVQATTPQFNFPVAYTYGGPVATALPSNFTSLVKPYAFPGAEGVAYGGLIPANQRDNQQTDQTIAKLQYQHNFSSAEYARVYAYSLYSDRKLNGADGAGSPLGIGEPGDYQVYTHTTGYAADFGAQLSSQHLLQFNASYIHSPSVRDNSTTWTSGGSTAFAVAVDANNPLNGVCYAVSGTVGKPGSCQPGDKQATFVTFNNALNGTIPASLAGTTCGTGACQYEVVENGLKGTYNVVSQDAYTASLSDQWKPTDRLTLDLGLKYHDYLYTGANTNYGARPFWFNAYNLDYCVNAAPGSVPITKKSLGIAVTQGCSTASTGAVTYTNVIASNDPADYTYGELEPRVGLTYALGPRDVIRASYGKYTQPTATAYEQYDVHQQNLPAYLGSKFYSLGFYGPGHNVRPEESFNTDFSLEHAFKGTDISMKVSPFYRATKNELTEFFIDPATQATAGLAVGSLRTSGVEFQLKKGSFDRNGLSAILSYTYTTARIKYSTLPNGGTILSPINNDIKTYNAYTSYCATHTGDARCGATTKGGSSAACFTPAGSPDPTCAAGSVANPYWNAPVQNLLDPNGSYWPTDPVIATTALGVNSYTVPHIATLVLNYRKDRFAITPSLQFQAGQRYGAPEANAGIDPASGCSPLAGSTTGDPRYPYGAAGGAPFDALTCGGALNAIPNVFTGKFDDIGAFTNPSQLLGSMTLSYDVTKNVGFNVILSNIINQCFGGTQAQWTGVGGPKVCSYESGEVSRNNVPTGNVYNPGATFEPFGQNPYAPYLGPYTMGVVNPSSPFSIFVDMHVRL